MQHAKRQTIRTSKINPKVPASLDLQRRMDEPIFNKILKKWVGRGELDYEVYLSTKTLLALQLRPEQRSSPDELMFQIVHQTQELWLKLLSHEMIQLVEALDRDALWDAAATLERAVRIARCIAAEMGVIETLTPDSYQVIRRNLGNGSGQESPGFNTVLMAAEGVSAAFDRLLARRNLAVEAIYLYNQSPDIKRVAEQMMDLDEGFQHWLVSHFMLVRRTIGVSRSVKALDGVPTQVLVGRMTQPLFRRLWDVRAEMTANWKREGGYAPGQQRDAPPPPPAEQSGEKRGEAA